MDDLYHQEILEHYKHPSNFGTLEDFDVEVEETNMSCGDSFSFQVKFTLPGGGVAPAAHPRGDLIIANIAFSGRGCAISTAAASLLTDYLKGKPVEEIKKIDIKFMQNLIGAEITATRIKCLGLPAKALQKI